MSNGLVVSKRRKLRCTKCGKEATIGFFKRIYGQFYIPKMSGNGLWNPIFYFCQCSPDEKIPLAYDPGNKKLVIPPGSAGEPV